MKKTLLIFLAMFAATVSGAQELVLQEGQSLPFKKERSFTRVQAGFRFRAEDDAYLPQEGDGLSQGEFHAASHRKLDSLSVVEGMASYERGVKRNVCWNTSSDWELLAPYVTVDSVGGDLQREQYRFGAHYARRKRGAFYSWAIAYRALHEFRDIDPRPRNITSDLSFDLQGGLQSGSYALSLAAGYRKYHQDQDIEFLDPRGNNTAIIHALGLGRNYGRFSASSSSMDVRFRGNGLGLKAMLEPVSGLGWTGGASWKLFLVDRQLKGQNEAPISTLSTNTFNVYCGRKVSSGRFYRSYKADASLRLRHGTEHVLDHVGSFLSLVDLPMYDEVLFKTGLSAVLSWEAGLTVVPRLGLFVLSAQGAAPERSLELSAIDASARAFYKWKREEWNYCLDGFALLRAPLGSSLVLPETDMRTAAHYNHVFGRWEDAFMWADVSFQAACRLLKDLEVYARPEVGMTFYSKGQKGLRTFICMGIMF